MNLLAPTDRSLSRPFRIVDGPSERGSRIGGHCPEGLPDLPDEAAYVMTNPLASAPPLFASIFITCGFRELLEARNDGFKTDERVTVITHAEDLTRSAS